MNYKVALITGISGMDAEALTDILLNKNYIVIGTYRKTANFDESKIYLAHNNNPNLFLYHCDIADKDSVNKLIINTLEKFGKIDELYLLAAQSHVGLSFSTPETSVLTNGISVFYFLDNLKNLSFNTRVYFAATSELLGGDPNKCPFTENSLYECRSPYSIGKELGVRWINYYQQLGMFATYGILFNHSNTSRNLSFFIRKVTNTAAKISLGKQSKIKLGNLNFYRDEHWSDLGCEMMWKMLQLDKPDTFLICKNECFHGEEFLNEAFGYFNLDWKKYVELDEALIRPNEVVKLVGDSTKAINKLNWNPKLLSFKEHISLMCDYDYKLELGENPSRTNIFNYIKNRDKDK